MRCFPIIILLLSSLCGVESVKEVKFGIILEKYQHIKTEDLKGAVDQVNQALVSSTGVKIIPSLEISYGTDPFKTLQRTCSLIQNGAVFIISLTSCPTSIPLRYMSSALAVPHITLPPMSPCDVENRKTDEVQLVPRFEHVFLLLAKIMRNHRWKKVVVFHDDYFNEDFVDHVRRTIQRKGQNDYRVTGEKIFDVQRSPDYTKAKLKELQNRGEASEFFILASEENTIKLLNLADSVGFSGEYFRWIIGNYDMDPAALFRISHNTNVLAVIRKLDEINFSPEGKLEENTINDFSISVKLDYIQDALHVAVKSIQESLENHSNLDLTQVTEVGCLLENAKTFVAGPMILEEVTRENEPGIYGKTGFVQYGAIPVKKPTRFGLVATPDLYLMRYINENDVSKWQYVANYTYGSAENDGWSGAETYFEAKANTLKGMTLKIVTIEEEPFIIKTEIPGVGVKYTGYCIDILEAIQRHNSIDSPFQYEIYPVEDGQYGVYDDQSNTWTGLVGDVIRGKADLAVAGMIRNYDREEVVDFTASYMDYGVGILIRKPQKTTSIFGFLEPLTVQVWVCICVATFAIGVVMFVLSRISPYSAQNVDKSLQFNFHNSMWFALASLMQQGTDITPRSISSRMLGTFWWFFTLIIIATYTANLAAFLTVTRMESPIESLNDLASQTKISYGTVVPSSLEKFFEEQGKKEAPYDKLWSYMSTMEPSPMVKDIEEGYERVLKGDYAFMWDYPVLQYQKKKHCDLMTVGKPFNSKNYAFAVRKGALYQEKITLSILSLQESGELEKIRQKWFEAESLCTDDDSSEDNTASGLELRNVAGVFYILMMGACLAFFTALIELVWYRFLREVSNSEGKQTANPIPRRNSLIMPPNYTPSPETIA